MNAEENRPTPQQGGSHNASVDIESTDEAVSPVPATTQEWLTWLYGEKPMGDISICRFTPSPRHRAASTPAEAAAIGQEYDASGTLGTYFRLTTLPHGFTPTKPGGRGEAKDSAFLYALGLDVDIKGPGHVADTYPETEEDARLLVKEIGMPEPSAWVHSGGGLYPFWVLPAPLDLTQPGHWDWADVVSRNLHTLALEWSKAHGWGMDPVADLARVYRLPGTTNRKAGLERPCVVQEVNDHRYTLAELESSILRAPRPAQAALPAAPAAPAAPAQATVAPPVQVVAEPDHLFASPSMVGTFTLSAPPAGEAEVREQVESLRDQLAAAPEGEGNATAARLAHMAGQYVGAGQIGQEEATEILLAALDAWTFAGGNRATQENTIRAQVAAGMNSPRAWGASAVPEIEDGKEIELAPANLPDTFWNARPELKHIRDSAHSRSRSADAVLGGVFARLSAKIDHRTRCDTGVGSPASLNFFAAIVGNSGGGKSSSSSIPRCLIPDENLEERPLGSGEGMAEAYYGQVQQMKSNTKEDGTVEQVPDGKRLVKKQVRHNLLFSKDEGMELVRVLERTGATVAEAIRSAWSGETIGQSNGTVETTRILRNGSYAMGLVIGFQEIAAAPLLDEKQVAVGTPQRFVWFSASDPTIPLDPPDDPGPLPRYAWEPIAKVPDGTSWSPQHITVDGDLKEEIRRKDWLRNRNDGSAECKEVIAEHAGIDAHKPLTLIKLSSLLALLNGRHNVTREDWDLALMVWTTSCLIRRRVVEAADRERARDSSERLRQAQARAKVSEIGRQEAVNEAGSGVPEMLLRRFERQTTWLKSDLRRSLKDNYRAHFAEAIEDLLDAGKISARVEGKATMYDYLG